MGTDLPAREPLLRALVDICGPDFARTAGPSDTVAGRLASFVAAPATTAAVADTMRLAGERGLAVIPRGSGSKLDWGTPPPGVDLLLDTGRLDGIWHHDAEAGTAEIGTGTTVRAVQAALALRGQRLAVDPPSVTATFGGVLAVNETGPLRHRFGTAADQVVSVAYVGRDGEVATSDGENGSPGIAEIDGVLLSARVRLEPLPAVRRWVSVPVATPRDVQDLIAETLSRQVGPSAVEMDLPAGSQPTAAGHLRVVPPPGSGPSGGTAAGRLRVVPPEGSAGHLRAVPSPGSAGQPRAVPSRGSGTAARGALAVLLEGEPADVAQRAADLEKSLGRDATTSPVAPGWWGRYPFGPDDVALRIAVPAADLQSAVYALRDVTGMPVPVRGSAGRGIVHAVLPGTLAAERVEGILDAVRGVLLARGGRCVAISAPRAISTEIDMASRQDLF
ncbi:FAD-binding oxidoreductase [Couchioplanes caeruleus]|uniref:FAD-binding oxidoreductase n=1 Tax=Couchioplanes caeruleus TaxID=56438 RepID=UPI0020BF8BB8|nr:FAD-binding oxidoreductase [Couchioplanes caeruleus]UQU64737.1 FAD-binding oxidoreductase [Couchioplanes caeruleus]